MRQVGAPRGLGFVICVKENNTSSSIRRRATLTYDGASNNDRMKMTISIPSDSNHYDHKPCAM